MTVSLLAVHHGGGVGGAPVSLLQLLKGLDQTDFRAHAVFTEPGDILAYAQDQAVHATVVPTGGAFFYSAHARLSPRSVAHFLRTFPRAVRTTRDALRRYHPDLVHLNTSVLLAWAAAARREGVPIVWVVREVLGPNARLRTWQAQFILRHARRVVAISNAVLGCFPRDPRLRRVYNAVDLAEFKPAESAMTRTELAIDPNRQVVMAIGSVQRPKGHWLLLDAFARLPETCDLVLVTGGVGSTYADSTRGRIKRAVGLPMDNLEAFLRDADGLGVRKRVHVTGFRRDVGHVLSACDVLAFPSLEAEGFGRPIIEAMAVARPVVATNVGPSAELLGSDAGVLVSADPRSLADALAHLLQSPQERARMGEAGRRRVEACFTLDRQVAEMSAIYREAVESA